MARRRLWLLALAALLAAVSAIVAAPARAVLPSCKLFADPAGGPSGNGQAQSPFGSVQQLASALGPGDTGCLAPDAVFRENVDLAGRTGAPGAPVRITNADPTRPATIEGVPGSEVRPVLNFGPDTAYVEVVGLRLRGRLAASGAPAIYLNGTGNALIGNDITHTHVTTCVYIGQFAGRRATGIVVDGNAIHSCGGAPGDTTAAGVGASYTNGLRITNNYIYGNPRFGIVLYPDADGTLIANNVVDAQGNGKKEGQGIQFGGDASSATDNTEVARNIVSNNETYQIGHNWGGGSGPVGGGNSVHDNCLFSLGGQGDFQPPPTGYAIGGGNVQGLNPQFVNPGAPPGGYALTPASPCKGKGPVPVASTDPEVTQSVDPEAAEVFAATFTGVVDNHFQAGTYGFELGSGGAFAPLPGGELATIGGPQTTATTVTGLDPSTTYAFRATATNGTANATGEQREFTTEAAPFIAPPAFTATYDHEPKRRGRVLDDIEVSKAPPGARALVTCLGKSCPFKTTRPIRDVRLIEGRVLRPGTTIFLTMETPAPVGRYSGRTVQIDIARRRKGTDIVRREGCIHAIAASIVDCLTISRRVTLYAKKPRFKFLRATKIPVGATVTVRCKGRGCPKLPRCRVAEGGEKSVLSLLGRSKVTRVGTRFEVRVLKPKTRGIVTRISLKRHNKERSRVVQSFGFLPPTADIPQSCESA